MRMWLVNPKKMCDQHLLGEHVEMHMFAGSIAKKRSIRGHVEKGQVETNRINERHDALAREMTARGMQHKSPLARVKCRKEGRVNAKQNEKVLSKRCKACKKLMKAGRRQLRA